MLHKANSFNFDTGISEIWENENNFRCPRVKIKTIRFIWYTCDESRDVKSLGRAKQNYYVGGYIDHWNAYEISYFLKLFSRSGECVKSNCFRPPL